MLTKKDIKKIPRSFDIIGDILIFSDFPPKRIKEKRKRCRKLFIKKIEKHKSCS